MCAPGARSGMVPPASTLSVSSTTSSVRSRRSTTTTGINLAVARDEFVRFTLEAAAVLTF